MTSTINYSFAQSPFGRIIIASTGEGICWMSFADNKPRSLARLRGAFPGTTLKEKSDRSHKDALLTVAGKRSGPGKVKIHLKGTAFQIKVWRALLEIPMGRLSTYGDIAKRIGHPKAVRAVGTAVGSNPIAPLIPCHRIIRSTGAIGKYYWGGERKAAMIAWESEKN